MGVGAVHDVLLHLGAPVAPEVATDGARSRVGRVGGGGWWLDWLVRDRETAFAAIEDSAKIESDLAVAVPEGRAYYPFQRAGIEFLALRKEALLADEMGTGKTIQIEYRYAEGQLLKLPEMAEELVRLPVD